MGWCGMVWYGGKEAVRIKGFDSFWGRTGGGEVWSAVQEWEFDDLHAAMFFGPCYSGYETV